MRGLFWVAAEMFMKEHITVYIQTVQRRNFLHLVWLQAPIPLVGTIRMDNAYAARFWSQHTETILGWSLRISMVSVVSA